MDSEPTGRLAVSSLALARVPPSRSAAGACRQSPAPRHVLADEPYAPTRKGFLHKNRSRSSRRPGRHRWAIAGAPLANNPSIMVTANGHAGGLYAVHGRARAELPSLFSATVRKRCPDPASSRYTVDVA